MDFWKSEDAEKRFGEVMHRALTNAPQTILSPDNTAVIVMSEDEHHGLVLCLQRLLELGEDPPEMQRLQPGEQNAWDFIQSLIPVDESGEGLFPEGYFERLREEERHCECCARKQGDGRTADAAD